MILSFLFMIQAAASGGSDPRLQMTPELVDKLHKYSNCITSSIARTNSSDPRLSEVSLVKSAISSCREFRQTAARQLDADLHRISSVPEEQTQASISKMEAAMDQMMLRIGQRFAGAVKNKATN